MRLVLCFLALGTWMCVDAASVQTSILQGFTAPMLECLQQRKVFYSGDNKCHNLPDEAPTVCTKAGQTQLPVQWLVLDSAKENSSSPQSRFEPVCKKKLCPGTLQVFWPADGLCHKSTEVKTLCPFSGHEVVTDKYGEGMCDCLKEPPHLRLLSSPSESACYELYKQGPCNVGSILQAEHIQNKGRVAVCRPDPCFNKTRGSRGKMYAPYNGKCYPLAEDRGPCQHPLVFKVSQRTFAPDCVGEGFSILKLPSRCAQDPSGDCPKEIKLAQDDKETEAYNLLTKGSRKRKRSSPPPSKG